MTSTFAMHGLVWRSAVDLHHTQEASEEHDLELVRGEDRVVGDEPPAGRELAHLDDEDGTPLYTIARSDSGVVLRFHRLCDFQLDPGLRHAVCHQAPRIDAGFVQVLATGMLVTTVLTLRGHPVLHASAVESDGIGMALVGASGMGKSTLATLLSQTGCAMISDDVLRVDVKGDRLLCRSGSLESRLRPRAIYLDREQAARETADGRLALRATRVAPDNVPLRVIAVPYPTRGLQAPIVERLRPAAALRELLRFPRIVGWRDPVTNGELFLHLGQLVRSVPVLRLQVPWQERLDLALGEEIRDLLLAAARP